MKIIFLDFDGVILTPRTKFEKPDPKCMANLNHLIRASRSKIVVTSTHRLISTALLLGQRLKKWGCVGEIVGITPNLLNRRGKEIELWLDGQPDTESFVILDDDSDMKPFLNRLVLTDIHGLTKENVEEALRILSCDLRNEARG